MQATERCGNCGTEVDGAAEVCPVCGALLAAYRNPLAASPAAGDGGAADEAAPPVAVPPRSDPLAAMPERDEAVASSPTAASPALREARARLLRTLAAPERELVALVREQAQPTATPVVTAPARQTPAAPVVPLLTPKPRPGRGRFAPDAPPVLAPRKPGFMVKGSVTVVLMWGLAFVLLSCLTFVVGAALVGGGAAPVIGGIGLLFGLIGAILIVFAMLVALVRRETGR